MRKLPCFPIGGKKTIRVQVVGGSVVDGAYFLDDFQLGSKRKYAVGVPDCICTCANRRRCGLLFPLSPFGDFPDKKQARIFFPGSGFRLDFLLFQQHGDMRLDSRMFAVNRIVTG